MKKIAFFCIPAQGHTNPTLAVVKELVERGNEVRYYSYDSMKERIEATGATYISCDQYDIGMQLKPEDADRVGKDIEFSTRILVNTTLAMDDALLARMQEWKPDLIVADSMATWGKLIALKLNIPFISSTTTFAFNQESAKLMKPDVKQILGMILKMGKINKHIKRLKDKGYPVDNFVAIIQNDNDTHTIVYTSKEFQPCAETFSDKYLFVGPSIRPLDYQVSKPEKKTIYISMGTVNNQDAGFFKNCIEALKGSDYEVIMSIGDIIDKKVLGEVPDNFTIEQRVNQMEVLQQADAFITHCGMNSVNEALYYQVPLILFPQTSEQGAVASQVSAKGAGFYLKDKKPDTIRAAVDTICSTASYREKAKEIAESFYRCGGAKAAADKIESLASGN